MKDEILKYKERLGVDHFIMRSQWPGLEQDKTIASHQAARRDFRDAVSSPSWPGLTEPSLATEERSTPPTPLRGMARSSRAMTTK